RGDDQGAGGGGVVVLKCRPVALGGRYVGGKRHRTDRDSGGPCFSGPAARRHTREGILRLEIEPADLEIIARCADGPVLGIIQQDGRIQLRIADPVAYPDHRAWLKTRGAREAPLEDAVFGFGMDRWRSWVRYPH